MSNKMGIQNKKQKKIQSNNKTQTHEIKEIKEIKENKEKREEELTDREEIARKYAQRTQEQDQRQGGRLNVSVAYSHPSNGGKRFQYGVKDVVGRSENRPVLLKLLAYSFLIIFLPLLTFSLTSSQIPQSALGFSPVPEQTAFIHGAIASIVVVNLVIGAYVISAFRED